MAYASGTGPITIGMPDELVRQIDERAARVGMTRAAWIRKATQWALEQPITARTHKEQL